MTNLSNAAPDRGALVYRYHERLYRLALLVAGDAGAAGRLVERAYRQLPADSADPEQALIQALLEGRPARRPHWAAGSESLLRAGIDKTQADALLRLLTRLTPLARLIVGLYYIAGSSPEEIATLLGPSADDQPVAGLLARFRLDAARALGLAPADADAALLARLDRWMEGQVSDEAALELRTAMFEQPDLRALRDGVQEARDLLPRAIPALFAAAPPLELTDRLLRPAGGRHARIPQVPARRAQALLALGVLALAAAIILVPSLLARRESPSAQRPPAPQDLIDAAIHRFDRAQMQQGVLHEQYRVERSRGGVLLIERWYDFASPNRLAVSVRAEGRDGNPILQISSDGQSLVQFRRGFDRQGDSGGANTDASASESEIQAVLPLLRSQPIASAFGRDARGPGDPGPLYLAQARSAGASFLGRTTALGRSAYLLTYQANQQPTQPPDSAAGPPSRIVLTIDAQTYALLDVSVLPEGAAESRASHPVQAVQFEILPNVPDSRFYLPSAPGVVQQNGIASVRFPYLSREQLLSLDAAAQRSEGQLLAPQQLPDARMRGLAVSVTNGVGSPVALLYEGEFQNVIVLPSSDSSQQPAAVGEERSAGDFRYQIVPTDPSNGEIAALAYRPEAPQQRVVVMLNDALATAAERENTLQSLIASLTPVDAQTLPTLRRNFQTPREAAGKQ
jgi:hypothetical protein